MKALAFAMAIVLVCVAGVAQADVIPGSLLTNSDFNTDLTGWLQAGGGGGSVAWSNFNTGNVLETVHGGQLITKDWEVQNVGANTFTIQSGANYYLSLVAGSPDSSAGGGLLVRLSDSTQFSVMTPLMGYVIPAAQLNSGFKEYLNYGFTPIAGNIGKSAQLWLDTLGSLTNANKILVDRVVITTSPIAAGSLYSTVPVPEPGTVVLLVTGLIGLLCYAWRKRK